VKVDISNCYKLGKRALVILNQCPNLMTLVAVDLRLDCLVDRTTERSLFSNEETAYHITFKKLELLISTEFDDDKGRDVIQGPNLRKEIRKEKFRKLNLEKEKLRKLILEAKLYQDERVYKFFKNLLEKYRQRYGKIDQVFPDFI